MMVYFLPAVLLLFVARQCHAVSTSVDSSDYIDAQAASGSIVEPSFQVQDQTELQQNRQSYQRNLADDREPLTPCGDAPPIDNGVYSLITVSLDDVGSSKSYLLTYTCSPGFRLIGTQTLTCQEDMSNRWNGSPPLCTRSDYDESDAAGSNRNTDCQTNPSPSEVLNCFPNIVVRFKYSLNLRACERYLACLNSPIGFATLEDCQDKCSGFVPTVRPVAQISRQSSQLMNGGRRGPQCLPGVPLSHSSCLDDSPNLIATLANNVTEILQRHNFYRATVNPPAFPPMANLRWDEDLAVSAERWAAQCIFDHNSADSRRLTGRGWNWVGQNLCAATFEQSWSDCVNSWGQEFRRWVYGVGPSPSNAVVGHYTQIVNANTTHVGCGRAQCSSGRYSHILACNYGPGGNIGDRNHNPYAFPYSVSGGGSMPPATTPARTATTTRLPPPPPTPATTLPGSRQSGGRRGPQCLPGVSSTHSSCLGDSANLVSTVRFNYDEILLLHNQVRSQVNPPALNMPMLQWSEELATSAERWAAQCRIAHNSGPDRRLPQWQWIGQNMRFATSDRSWPETVLNWANEARFYQYGVGPVPANATVGHYTQMIWGDTTHIGCGRAICRNIFWNYIYVCNYGPGGNVGVNNQSPFLRPYIASSGPAPVTSRPPTNPPPPPPPVTRATTRAPPPPPPTRPTTRAPPATRATLPPTTPPISGRMSGGLRGPQCFANVRSDHASCLPDSPYLERTFRFQVEEVLRVHNQYRRSVNPPARYMPDLQYSDELAVMAERWAAQCPEGHDDGDSRATRQWPWVGQNICWKSGADETWTECITAWADERLNWRYGVGAVPSTAVVGHYTQMIWADTLFVGCGKAKCANTEWEYNLVCNYGPGGNIGNGFSDPYATPYQRA